MMGIFLCFSIWFPDFMSQVVSIDKH
jgi:hypothetical protein